jgi:WD40 repeat protein
MTGKKVGPLQSPDHPIQAAAFSPDGKLLLTGDAVGRPAGAARLWEVTGLKPVSEPLKHRGQVGAVAFSRDGRWLLTGEQMGDNAARLWDAGRRQVVGPPLTHRDLIHAVAFSPDGETVLTASSDGTARLWERATGRALGPELPHGREVKAGAFSPDGGQVLTGSWDGTARLWAVPRPVLGDPERVRLWVEVQTGLELDEQGNVQALDETKWRERRRRLEERDGAARVEAR